MMTVGLDSFQAKVGEWAESVFTKATDKSVATHLLREAIELWLEAHDNGMGRDSILATLHTEVVQSSQKYEAGTDPGLPSPLGKGYGDPENFPAESADCFLLLLHLAHRRGFSLIDAASEKLEENRRRRWGEPDAEGVVEHIRDGE